VKQSGKDEPMWVSIHIYMEKMLAISLYSCLYLNVGKMLSLSYYLLCFLFKKIRKQLGGTGSAWKWGKGAQTMNTHVSKCKNNKIQKIIEQVGSTSPAWLCSWYKWEGEEMGKEYGSVNIVQILGTHMFKMKNDTFKNYSRKGGMGR
jgi:hypothetical protein